MQSPLKTHMNGTDLALGGGRYENRTQQNLLKVKYHTLKFLTLVSTWEQNQKKEEQAQTNKQNN